MTKANNPKMTYLRISEYTNIKDGSRTYNITVPATIPDYIFFRRRLQLLGMKMMVIAARQRDIKVTDYPCAQPGYANPKDCSDLRYEYLGTNHVKIRTVFGDVGENKGVLQCQRKEKKKT